MSDSIDPRSGFCSSTRVFHSIRPHFPLPDIDMSVAEYVLSLLKSELNKNANGAGIIDAVSGKCVLYAEVVRRTESLAAALRRRYGLRRGDVAFVLLGNSVNVPVVYLALMLIGVVVSPGNPVSTGIEIDRQLKLCQPVIAFATEFTCPKISKLKFGTILVDSLEFKDMLMYKGNVAEQCGSDRILQSDAATILYSSGTTGRVKGVVSTHRNYIAMVAGAKALRQAREMPAMMCCPVPFFHVYGLLVMLWRVAFGESMVIMEKTDKEALMRAIERYKVTHLVAAPPLVLTLIGQVGRYDTSSLELVACGGAPLREAVIKKFQRLFPNVQLAPSYGLTETTGGITRTIGLDESRVMGASGRLAAHCQAKIVDPQTGEALSPMKIGEIWFRGPTVMKGYRDDEEATRATFDSEGWLKTGDLGYFNKNGFLFFIERLKELIKYNAYQVAPAELEQILQSHPDILEAAVIPYPDEKAGQVPMSFIVKDSNSNLTESEVKKFIADQVAPYKRVRRVSFVDSIPKNATGKILRKELIKIALSPKMSKL